MIPRIEKTITTDTEYWEFAYVDAKGKLITRPYAGEDFAKMVEIAKNYGVNVYDQPLNIIFLDGKPAHAWR